MHHVCRDVATRVFTHDHFGAVYAPCDTLHRWCCEACIRRVYFVFQRIAVSRVFTNVRCVTCYTGCAAESVHAACIFAIISEYIPAAGIQIGHFGGGLGDLEATTPLAEANAWFQPL